MTRSRIITVILVLGAILVIFLCVKWRPQLKGWLGDEPYQIFLQFSVITVVGGLVSTVFAELKREQDLREARRQSIREFHARALAAYNGAKRCRRLFPVRATYTRDGQSYIRGPEYRTFMTELEDIQLTFEAMKREVIVAKHLFSPSEELRNNLKSMEAYLRGVLKEFEDTDPSKIEGEISASAMPRLRDFIGDDFVASFADPYDQVEAAALKLILR